MDPNIAKPYTVDDYVVKCKRYERKDYPHYPDSGWQYVDTDILTMAQGVLDEKMVMEWNRLIWCDDTEDRLTLWECSMENRFEETREDERNSDIHWTFYFDFIQSHSR